MEFPKFRIRFKFHNKIVDFLNKDIPDQNRSLTNDQCFDVVSHKVYSILRIADLDIKTFLTLQSAVYDYSFGNLTLTEAASHVNIDDRSCVGGKDDARFINANVIAWKI